MVRASEYEKIAPHEKAKLSRQLAALLCLHRHAKIWSGNYCSTNQIVQWCERNTLLSSEVMAEWLKWKSYNPGKKENAAECWLTWFQIELGEIFRPFYSCYCCPESVKDAARIYLNAVKQLYWETGKNDLDESCPLTRKDWEKLEIATTVLFFREWMQTQPQMRQSIHDFAKAPFGDLIPEDQLSKVDEHDDNAITYFERRYRSLVDAHDEIGIMLGMGQIQKKRETYSTSPYEENTTKGYLIPYTQLCAMELIAKGKVDADTTGRDRSCFRIFKYISQRREVLRTPSDKQSFAKIANACTDYSAVLNRIAEWGRVYDDGKIKDPKRYVIGSMMAMELEEAYRLHFAGAAASLPPAQKRKGRLCDCEYLESKIAHRLLGRIPYKIIPAGLWNSGFNQWRMESISAHNILNYSTDLEYIYSAPLENCEVYIDKTILLRMEQIDLLVVLLGVFQNQIKKPWSEFDYESVAQFLFQEYNIVDTLRNVAFPDNSSDKGKRHYKEMRKFYEMAQTWEKDGMNQAYRTYVETIEI